MNGLYRGIHAAKSKATWGEVTAIISAHQLDREGDV
jgi:hypothetical protein